jgi:bacillopeptidase F (M6 metalloprotease family)
LDHNFIDRQLKNNLEKSGFAFDLEKDYDYLYVTVSEDGQSWKILKTPSGTDKNPSGNSYGWGYTGLSGSGKSAEWVQESVDLSEFAGKKVQLRFEYVTDFEGKKLFKKRK